MKEYELIKRRVVRISTYVVFIAIAFLLSLFTMPFELFFLPSGIILMTLRNLEKELAFFSERTREE